jgi:exosortase E/protease (VPEID-CTERM system)
VIRSLLGIVSTSSRQFGLSARLGCIGVLFVAEKILLGSFVDFQRAQEAQGFGALVRVSQHWGFRFLVTWAAATAIIAYVRSGPRLRAVNLAASQIAPRRGWWIIHFLLVVLLIPLSFLLYRDVPGFLTFATVAWLWIALAAGAALAAFAAMAPWPIWKAGWAALNMTWLYSAAAAIVGASAMELSQGLWIPTSKLTFDLVHRFMAPFLPSLNADSSSLVLSTDRFAVQISQDCSGLEGVGLISAFCLVWLLKFRRDYRFPRALLLVPVGVLLVFTLNVLRIAALIFIGDAGFPGISGYGFHSQAGWIAFNVAACGLCYFTRRDTWFNSAESRASGEIETENPTAAYVMPLLGLLAAGMVSRATASDFEHLSPLRLVAGAAMLVAFRQKLATLDWRCSWRGPAVGVAVFLLWIASAHYLLPPMGRPHKLAALAPPWNTLWIASALATSVGIVPIAEELAYRGFLMRRLCTMDFESLQYRSVGWFSLLVTSVAFGMLHGEMWLPAIVAGLGFGALLIRRGQIGEPIAAHAVANVLIAAAVLGWNNWQLW